MTISKTAERISFALDIGFTIVAAALVGIVLDVLAQPVWIQIVGAVATCYYSIAYFFVIIPNSNRTVVIVSAIATHLHQQAEGEDDEVLKSLISGGPRRPTRMGFAPPPAQKPAVGKPVEVPPTQPEPK